MNIYIVSSPLQLFHVFLLLKKNFKEKNIVFTENLIFESFMGCKVVNIPDTRGNFKNYDNVYVNIKKFLSEEVNLYVSDPFWPFNNYVITRLNKDKLVKNLYYYDEGLVLYWLNKLSCMRWLREIYRYIYFSLKIKYFTRVRRFPFNYPKNSNIISFRPDLLVENKNIIVSKVNHNDLVEYLNHQNYSQEFNNKKKCLIFLAQPYYRIFGNKIYREMCNKVDEIASNFGYEDVFIKMHPSENIADYNTHYKKYKILNGRNREIPFECLSAIIPDNYSIISFNTSSFIFLKNFGFKGEMYSVGLDIIAKNSKSDNGFYKFQKSLFTTSGVKIC